MGNTVIQAEHLCKRYIIDHEQGGESYTNLRDQIAGKVKKIFTPAGPAAAKQKEEIMVLNNISFSIEQGKRVGIIGSNGAGKSTLLKILSKIIEPTSGTVEIAGRVVSLLEVGTGFHPELTGRENIFLNGVILGMSRASIRKKFDQIVAFSEIGQFLDTPVKRYSSGMYMRLAFAVAAHLEPEILIVDEVLAVGDTQFQKKCLAKMDEISKDDGITVLFVSHNLEAVRSFCNTGLFLHKGTLLSQGPIDDIVDDYARYFSISKGEFTPNTDSPLYFNSITLGRNNYYFEEELILNCELVADQRYARYIIGISIANKYEHKAGTALIHSHEPLTAGTNNVTLKIPLATIVPGDYSITIAIALDETLDNLDVVFNYPEFSILSDNKNQQLFARWSQSWGGNMLSGADILSEKPTVGSRQY